MQRNKDFKKIFFFFFCETKFSVYLFISFLYPAASRRTSQYSIFPYGVKFSSWLAYIPNNTCYEWFLPYSWANVTIMVINFNAKPFRNSPYFSAHVHIKCSKVSWTCVWHITHVFTQLRPLFLAKPGVLAVSGTAYRSIFEWHCCAKIRPQFLIFVTPQLDKIVNDRSHQHSRNVVHASLQQCNLP